HADSVHRQIRHPCPLAKEHDCVETFTRKGDAAIHSKIHLGIKHPCPYAAKLGCKQVFSSQRGAKEHAICHSHPFLCLHNGCSERFTSAEDALQHSNSPEHLPISFLICPVPCCRASVSGHRFTAGSIRQHRDMHIGLGHVTKAEYEPQKAVKLPLRSNFTLYSLILQHGTQDPTDQTQADAPLGDINDELEHLDVKDTDFNDLLGENCDDIDGEMASEFSEQQNFSDLANGVLSKEHRLRILDRNTFKWVENGKHLKVMLGNLGLRCIGPESTHDSLVTRRCPEEVTIDLDTARLGLRKAKGTLTLSARCIACQVVIDIRNMLTRKGIEIQSGDTVCVQPSCVLRAIHMPGRCPRHLGSLMTEATGKKTVTSRSAAQSILESTSRNRWTYPPEYNIVRSRTEEILQGRRPGSDLVVLDDEFSPASKQLWEFALIEYVSGNELINTTVKHRDKIDHHTPGDDPFLRLMSQAKSSSVYASSRRSSIGHMNVREIASSLQRLGISQDTIFIAYHSSATDLQVLRRLLVSEGYDNILPPDRNCIPLINILRPNIFKEIPKEQRFSLSLEFLFPLMYPRHHLIGLNHQELVDYQQARLVCKAFDELCKPVEERGEVWQAKTVATSSQTSILDWLQDEGAGGKINMFPSFFSPEKKG
ncbi:hypothetical protein GQ53DRAFT_652574, partial [Thozetella sp. PMI_491]